MFFVLEGIDGSGKETQVKMLVETLKKAGKKVEVIEFPDYNSGPGKKIGQYLDNKLQLTHKDVAKLYADDRRLHQERIKKWLEEGVIVVSDRYAYSNIAYQRVNGVDYDYLLSLDKDMIFPDLVFFVDTTIAEVIRRMNNSRKKDKYESSKNYLARVSETYRSMCDGSIEVFGRAKWIRIDGNKTIDEVQKDIWRYVEACLSG